MSRYARPRTVSGNDVYGQHLRKSRRALQAAVAHKAALVELSLRLGGAAGRVAATKYTRQAFELVHQLRRFDRALEARAGLRT